MDNVVEAIQIKPVHLSRIETNKCPTKTECIIVATKKYDGKMYGPLDKSHLKSMIFLPFMKDHATYMLPDPEYSKEPTVFTTSMLTGCDVWVGWCDKQVFVIHISSSKTDAVANLQYKETKAVAAIARMNENRNVNKRCFAYHRFSHDYTSDDVEQQVIDGVEQYWQQFRENHRVTAEHFYAGPSLFYMVYQRKQWSLKMRYTMRKIFIFNQHAL